jgi:hypothetical protein
MGEEKFVKLLWTEPNRTGRIETHSARGFLVSSEGSHFTLRFQDGRQLCINRAAVLKIVEVPQ